MALGEELAAPTPVHNARRRLTLAKSARPSQIWAGRGSYPANAGQKHFDKLDAKLGDNFPAIIVADPKKLRDILPRCKQATHTKILEACIALTEEADLAAALRDCSGSEKIIATILETRADGLRRYTPYDLIGDDGLTFGQADKLAQSAYGQQFRPFDPAGLARAAAAAECMIAERAKLRGDTGAPVEKVHHDLALQYAVPTDTFQKAAAHLAERRGFVLKPDDPSHIWIGRYHHAERNIAAIVTTLLDKGTSVIKRRPSRNVTLFPGTEAERVATLNDSQHAFLKIVSFYSMAPEDQQEHDDCRGCAGSRWPRPALLRRRMRRPDCE